MKNRILNVILQIYWYCKRKIKRPLMPINPDGKVYVNLGSGRNTGKEFINVDAQTLPEIHYISDITDLRMFRDNSVDMLYACHVVEHIPRSKLLYTLQEWRRVLKPNGLFRFAVPDFDQLLRVYNATDREIKSIENQLMGQDAPYHNHCSIWNKEYAERILRDAGFHSIERWDYATADHHDFTDKSSRIMIVNNENIPISLNIEARK
jgi:predicted SAM-dependent methyltransferase